MVQRYGEVGERSEEEEVENNEKNGEVEKKKSVEIEKNTSDEVIREEVKRLRASYLPVSRALDDCF